MSLIEAIHAAEGRFVLSVAGGGVTAISDLLAVPGASATVLEATVPYHPQSLSDYLGATPESAASAVTARRLAMRAWMRACSLTGTSENVFGLGATSALATLRHRRGEDRCHIAIQSATTSSEFSLVLSGHRDRSHQERLVADLILHQIAGTCGIPVELPAREMGETPVYRHYVAPRPWTALLLGEQKSTFDGAPPGVIFPGAFNPLHHGHQAMIEHAEARLGQRVHLEISIRNVDKPPIDFLEMKDRQSSIGDHPLIYSDAPTFVEKARLFPGTTFVVGVDTLIRIAEPRYYQGEQPMIEALQEMADLDVGFLVFGRTMEGRFQALDDLTLPTILRDLCQGVDGDVFRQDISSTDLRREARQSPD